jgi:hypothetical protein
VCTTFDTLVHRSARRPSIAASSQANPLTYPLAPSPSAFEAYNETQFTPAKIEGAAEVCCAPRSFGMQWIALSRSGVLWFFGGGGLTSLC